MSQSHYLVLEDRALIAVSGEDRVSFLQGLVSNDVTKVSAGRAIWSAFLTPQGKFLHEFFIASRAAGDGEEAALLLSPERERRDAFLKRLSLFKLRAKVSLEPLDWAVVALYGDDLEEATGLPAEAGAAKSWLDGCVFRDPRQADLGCFAFLPSEGLAARLEAEGFAPGKREAFDARRIALGLPDGSRDLEVEKTILLEAGFDELGGVDWKKGCYMGQELTARTKYRGLVKRRIVPLRMEGPMPAEGAAITLDGKEVGVLRSRAGGLALAELRLAALHNADGQLMSGDCRLTPALPAWLKLPAS